MLRLQPLVQRDRTLGVGAALHVEPDDSAVLGRALGQTPHVGERALLVDVEAQLRQLDREFARDPPRGDVVKQAQIVLRCRVRFLEPADVLAEARKEAADVLAPERLGLGKRRLWSLTGHEATDGAPRQRQMRDPLAKPRTTCHPEQQPAHPTPP